MMETGIKMLPRWMWWPKGECVVEIVKRGHYPDAVMVKLPNDVMTEVELTELENK